jgi:hypothetical protein
MAGIAVSTTALAQDVNPAQTYGNEMRQSLERGNEIFQRQRAVDVATNAVSIERLKATQAVGWAVERADAAWRVRFIRGCDTGLCAQLEVVVDLNAGTAVVAEYAEAEPLSAIETASWRARQTALATEFEACAPRYETVVIPETDPNGMPRWVAYLLPASDDPDAIHLTGYHRITVSGDGRTVLRAEPLANSCLTMDRNPDASAIVVTHVMQPYPIETHVYTALHYGLPVVVTTGQWQYLVDGRKIVVLDPKR